MTTVKIKRGLEANRSSIIPAEGELLYTTDEKKTYIGDGSTSGGNALSNDIVTSDLNKSVTYMSKSGHNSQFLLVNGKLYSTSGNSAGAANGNRITGRGLDNQSSVYGCDNFKLVPMPSTSPIIKVGHAGQAAYALLTNGELYTWGYNQHGTLGLGHTSPISIPTLAETNVSEVYDHPSNGGYSVNGVRIYIKKTDGYIYGAGYNSQGQLGLGDNTLRSTFTQITSLGTNVIGFWNMGSTYGCAVVQKSDHSIWVAGYNGYGQLGNGNTTDQTSFIDVTSAWGGGSGYVLKQVIGGFGYYYTGLVTISSMGMLLDNGTTTIFKMAGANTNKQLGDLTLTDRSTPVTPNVGIGRITEVAFLGALGCVQALKEDNDLYSWGRNNDGQIGNGVANTTKVDPVIVESNVTKLFSDGMNSHNYGYLIQSFIKKVDGNLYATGNQDSTGYLGNGLTTSTHLYQRVLLPFDIDVQDIGHFVTITNGRIILAMGSNGKIYAWGYNAQNGVTNSSTINCLAPIQIELTEDNI